MDYDSKLKQSVEVKGTSFAAPLTMYAGHPVGELTIEEFLELGWRRRSLLERVQEIALSDDTETDNAAREELIKRKLREALKAARLYTQKDDVNSHFIMRMAQCSSETHRQVFLRQECLLFKYKCRYMTTNTELTKLLSTTNLPFETLSQQDIPPFIIRYLSALARGWSGGVFRMPLTQPVYDLVHHRDKVVVHAGYVYMRDRDISDLVVGQFRVHLARGAAMLARKLRASTHSSAELQSMLKSLQQADSAQYKATQASGAVSLEQLPQLAAESFPPCMRAVLEQGKRDGHLKHHARLQFGLFLKGVGLPLDAALLFWRQLFSKRFTPDKFEKEYAYNIRHTYGAEGKRQDLTPMGCVKLVQSNPAPGEPHGCPFTLARSRGRDRLRVLLERGLERAVSERGALAATVDEALNLADAGHFQVACGCVFRAAHPGCALEGGVRHPNEYFDLSREYHAQHRRQGTAGAGSDSRGSCGSDSVVSTSTGEHAL